MSDITANIVVSMPSQLFTLARSFKAASNGKIYIGLPDTDPTNPENQIQVYIENEDSSLVPVSQPLIINSGGFPVYNGEITKFVTTAGHSMAVYDAYDVQQHYFPNVLKYEPDQFKAQLSQPDGFKYIGRCESISLLRSIEPSFPNQMISLVSHTAGKGIGGGFFSYDDSDSTSQDNNGTVIVTPGGKRWKRVINGERVIPQWFGALGDGIADDSAAFTSASGSYNEVHVPFTAAGYVVGGIPLANGKRFKGEGRVKLICKSSSAFNVTSYSLFYPSEISGFTIDMNGASPGSGAIVFKTSLTIVFNVRISDMSFTNCYGAIIDETSSANYIVDVLIEDVNCSYTKGIQFKCNRSRGFLTLRDFRVDHTYNTSAVTWGGIYVTDMIGIELEKVDVVGPTQITPAYQSQATGITLIGVTGGGAGSASIWLRRVLVDNTMATGISIFGCHNVYGVDVTAYQNLGSGIIIENVMKSQFTNVKTYGSRGLSGAAPGATGVSLNNCEDVIFTNLASEQNNGSGVVMSNCTNCKVIGGYSNQNAGYGYVESGTATRNSRIGVTSLGNGLGALNQVGAQSATVNWYGSAGTFTAQTVGAAIVS